MIQRKIGRIHSSVRSTDPQVRLSYDLEARVDHDWNKKFRVYNTGAEYSIFLVLDLLDEEDGFVSSPWRVSETRMVLTRSCPNAAGSALGRKDWRACRRSLREGG